MAEVDLARCPNCHYGMGFLVQEYQQGQRVWCDCDCCGFEFDGTPDELSAQYPPTQEPHHDTH